MSFKKSFAVQFICIATLLFTPLDQSKASPVAIAAPFICAGPQLVGCLVAGGLSLMAAIAISKTDPVTVIIEKRNETDAASDDEVESIDDEDSDDRSWELRFSGRARLSRMSVSAKRKELTKDQCLRLSDEIKRKSYYDSLELMNQIRGSDLTRVIYSDFVGSDVPIVIFKVDVISMPGSIESFSESEAKSLDFNILEIHLNGCFSSVKGDVQKPYTRGVI